MKNQPTMFDSPSETPVIETVIVEWSNDGPNDGQWRLRNGDERYPTAVTAMDTAETRYGKRFWIPKGTRTYEGQLRETP
jgi:hypothetical protein